MMEMGYKMKQEPDQKIKKGMEWEMYLKWMGKENGKFIQVARREEWMD